ncbi:hypothetical protein BGW38_006577 [Lunasporangiospora selenospora]|uniref:Dienelactone hydrolase domain-containing protein n=1 Tax=Lunasporangiospora selenospora TaxID=979761 RepID=A0A9P6FME7_9FUNG|nr:hypothetical protein BGW38_006577 [Lunasporangiospora selenospora]
MTTLVAACCNTPPTQAQWQEQGEYKPLTTIDGYEYKTYRTGPKDSKRGVVAIYDIFAYHPTGLQFFDSHGGFQVTAPDFFKGNGIPDEVFGNVERLMKWIGDYADYHKNHIGTLIKAAADQLRAEGCTTVSVFGQCWGSLMSVLAVSEEDSQFLAAGGPHPSFTTIDAVKNVKAPLILLASKDEGDMAAVVDSLKSKNFPVESFHKRFNNMHHGWTGGRGAWAIPEQLEAGLEAVDLLGAYFAKVAQVAESKL